MLKWRWKSKNGFLYRLLDPGTHLLKSIHIIVSTRCKFERVLLQDIDSMSMAHGGMAATTSSSFNFRTQQYVGNRPTSPTGLVQLEAPNFMKYRKRNLSFGSAIDLAKVHVSIFFSQIIKKKKINFYTVNWSCSQKVYCYSALCRPE